MTTRIAEEPDQPPEDEVVVALFSRLNEDPTARDEITERFQPLAVYLARRFGGRGEPVEDLIQVANIGLLAAIDRFDTARGVQFSTYAAATIVGELKRHFRDKGWAIRVPRRMQELGIRVYQALPALHQALGRSPTISELAAELDASEEQILEAIDAGRAYSTESLDAPMSEDGITALDTVGEVDPSIELVEQWATLAPAVEGLPPRERKVLYLRFVRDLTQSEIAEEIGVSQMHVSRILSQTLRTLRESMDR
jgi:RNA polymerase sigma-B factor